MTGLYNFFQKRGQLFALLLGLISVVIAFGSVFSGLGAAGFDAATDLNAVLKNGGGNGFDFFNLAIMIPVILTVIAVVLWLIFGLGRLVTNPKGSIVVLLGAVLLIGLFFVLYSSSIAESDGPVGFVSEKFGVTPGVSKFISGGIKCTIILTALSIITMVVLEIINLFK